MADQKRLVPCPTCGNPCSPRAAACPKCGEPLLADDLQSLEDSFGDWQGPRGKVNGAPRASIAPTGASLSPQATLHPVELNSYQGTRLVESDYAAMVALEEACKNPVPKTEEVVSNTFGFTEQSGYVLELGLFGQGLWSLPEAIGNFRSLGLLRLYGNQLTQLPDTIGNLTSLHTLSLEWNQLTQLPESIGTIRFQLNACKCLA